MKREGKGGGIASENEVQKMFGYSVFDKGNILLYFFQTSSLQFKLPEVFTENLDKLIKVMCEEKLQN